MVRTPKYDVFVAPSGFDIIRVVRPSAAEEREEESRRREAAWELSMRYLSACGEADGEFHRSPAEKRTPEEHLRLLEEKFKKGGLCYIVFKGLEARDMEEAKKWAEDYAFHMLQDKAVPPDLRGRVRLTACSAEVYPKAESVTVDPPKEDVEEQLEELKAWLEGYLKKRRRA